MQKTILLLRLSLLFFLTSLIFTSCKKFDTSKKLDLPEINYEEKFFIIPQGTSPTVIRIINKIKQQNDQYHFVNDFVKKHGFPKWDFAELKPIRNRSSIRSSDQNGQDTLVMIPVANELLEKIKDVMACEVNAVDIVIKLIEDYTYKYYGYEPNAEGKATAKDIAAMFMKFEMKIYDQRIFQIKDVELAKKILGENWKDELTHLILKEDPVTNEIGFYRTINVVVVPGVAPQPNIITLQEVVVLPPPKADPIYFPIAPSFWGFGGFSNWWDVGGDPNSAGGGGSTPGTSTPGSSPGSNGTPTTPGTTGGSSSGSEEEEPGWETPPCYGYWQGEQYVRSFCNDFTAPSNSALVAMLNLNHAQINWLQANPEKAEIIFECLEQSLADENPATQLAYWDHYSIEAIVATKVTIDAAMNNLLGGPYDEYHNAIMAPYLLQYNIAFDPGYWVRFSINCALIHLEHPEYGELRVYWEAYKETLHDQLDFAGLVPVIGEIADLANGYIYTLEGDGVNATLSYASAIPVAGWYAAGIKFAKKTLTVAAVDGTKRTLKWVVDAAGKIKFGDRGLLRKVLGLPKGDPRAAHHLIPWEHCDNELIQKAAKGNDAFHMNELLNGIPLSAVQHNSGGHALYNEKVVQKLQSLWNTAVANNFNEQQCANVVRNLSNNIRNWITTHPNESINNIIIP